MVGISVRVVVWLVSSNLKPNHSPNSIIVGTQQSSFMIVGKVIFMISLFTFLAGRYMYFRRSGISLKSDETSIYMINTFRFEF